MYIYKGRPVERQDCIIHFTKQSQNWFNCNNTNDIKYGYKLQRKHAHCLKNYITTANNIIS